MQKNILFDMNIQSECDIIFLNILTRGNLKSSQVFLKEVIGEHFTRNISNSVD